VCLQAHLPKDRKYAFLHSSSIRGRSWANLADVRVKEKAEAVEYKLGLKRKLRIVAEDTRRRLPQVGIHIIFKASYLQNSPAVCTMCHDK